MDLIASQLEQNAWANGAVARTLAETPKVAEVTMYDGEPLSARLMHLAGVERAFLDVLRGDPVRPSPPGTAAALTAYIDDTGAGLVAMAETLGVPGLEREFFVPWWERAFTAGEILAQVLAHSGQHRSEVAWELARAGIDTGELDFIGWAAGGRPGPGQPLPEE